MVALFAIAIINTAACLYLQMLGLQRHSAVDLTTDVSPRNGWACYATIQLMGFWMSVLAVDGIAMLHCS